MNFDFGAPLKALFLLISHSISFHVLSTSNLEALLIFNLIEHLTKKLWEIKIVPYSNFCDFLLSFAIFYNFAFLLQPHTLKLHNPIYPKVL